MFTEWYTQNCSVTQFKYSHHERCLGVVLWLNPDKDADDQQHEGEDADDHYTPCFHTGKSIYGLRQSDAQCDQTYNWKKKKEKKEKLNKRDDFLEGMKSKRVYEKQ